MARLHDMVKRVRAKSAAMHGGPSSCGECRALEDHLSAIWSASGVVPVIGGWYTHLETV